MSDLISREDAIKAVAIAVLADKDELEAIKAIPSVQVSGDLISRQDAIEAVRKLKIVEDNKNYPDYAYNAGIETAIKTCGCRGIHKRV